VRYRYELFKNKGLVTHFTSNKTFSEIEELYGSGTSTRLKEMCHEIHWRGGSLR
jgi:DNA replication protein DnaC